ncbi:hypothetical protein [Loktanella sp. S4079]|uniref:hypothetical protein n=1 Tax=Loktanella sp. S4079 TaxID=579483 RepID=UPI0005F9DA81|nr:hypothetical protein [Loktanella sp. S4079]KJZ20507.1 hypothetical protein TW80_06905 [Loktanella sp. S4079]
MSTMKSHIISAVIALQLAATGTSAQTANEQLNFFATCAGRLSAMMEFQWMFDGTQSEETMQQRNDVVRFIEAIMLPEQGREIFQIRIASKQAHSALLTRAVFNDDVADAQWARLQAARLTQECTAMLLS